MRDSGDREMTPIPFPGGTIEVKKSRSWVALEIHHPYRFGETVKLDRDQALELAEKLREVAEK
jgi:hypothetical protein